MPVVPNCCGCPCTFLAPDAPPEYLKATFSGMDCIECISDSAILEPGIPDTPDDQTWRPANLFGPQVWLDCSGCPREYTIEISCDSNAVGGGKASVVSCSPFKLRSTIQLYAGAVMVPCGPPITVEITETDAP